MLERRLGGFATASILLQNWEGGHRGRKEGGGCGKGVMSMNFTRALYLRYVLLYVMA